MKVIPVILAGGGGTRLWPASRRSHPKQFADLGLGPFSLFQLALSRLDNVDAELQDPFVVASEQHRFLVLEQAAAVEKQLSALLLEPSGKNTCGAIATVIALLEDQHFDGSDRLVVLPSDHFIQDRQIFCDDLIKGLAFTDGLVTLGVNPEFPHSGFGYILPAEEKNGHSRIKNFIEKPDEDKAQQLISKGALWNAGIFAGSLESFRKEIATHASAVWHAASAAVSTGSWDGAFFRLGEKAWKEMPAEPFDRSVMEKTANSYVVPLTTRWSDLGDWNAIWRHLASTEFDNVTEGPVSIDDEVEGSIILSNGAAVAAAGIKNLIVVAHDDAVLVANRDAAQSVGAFVDKLKALGISAAEASREDHRPWGTFCVLAEGDRYQVKRLTVKPGEALSLQMHHHRAEHWIVVSGTAEVTINEQEQRIGENQSVYIPIGAQHRLANLGPESLEIIEVQSGSYFGEDDIIRFNDRYGRK